MGNILKWIENVGLNFALCSLFGVLFISTMWIFSDNLFKPNHIVTMAVSMYCYLFFARYNDSDNLEYYLNHTQCLKVTYIALGLTVVAYSVFLFTVDLIIKLVDFVSRIQIVYN